MVFAHRTIRYRHLVVAAAFGVAACTESFAPSVTAIRGSSTYERVVARLESAAPVLIPNSGAFKYFVPGDVVRVRYRVVEDGPDEDRLLRDGDILRLDVSGRPDLSRRRTEVETDGHIILPLLGRVQAGGDTLDQLAMRLGLLYRLENVRGRAVDLLLVSAVRGISPAISEFVEEKAVSEGMIVDLQDIGPIDASRAPEAVWADIGRAYRDRLGDDVEVEVGRISLAPRYVYVVGDVRRTGRVSFEPGMSATMAVTSAGGLRSTANPERLTLMRLMPDRRVRYGSVRLGGRESVQRGRGATTRLLPNDVILVPGGGTDSNALTISTAAMTSSLPLELRRELAPSLVQRTTSRSSSCVRDIDHRNRALSSALVSQLRSPVMSQNYVWTISEHFENRRYEAAERLAIVSLSLRKDVLGQTNLSVAQGLNTLGLTYDVQGRHADAAAMYRRALQIQEEILGPTNAFVASTLENLASAFAAECRYAEARPLHQRALSIRETAQGPGHAEMLRSLAVFADFEEQMAAASGGDLRRGPASALRR